jgi:hypothetical protein
MMDNVNKKKVKVSIDTTIEELEHAINGLVTAYKLTNREYYYDLVHKFIQLHTNVTRTTIKPELDIQSINNWFSEINKAIVNYNKFILKKLEAIELNQGLRVPRLSIFDKTRNSRQWKIQTGNTEYHEWVMGMQLELIKCKTGEGNISQSDFAKLICPRCWSKDCFSYEGVETEDEAYYWIECGTCKYQYGM